MNILTFMSVTFATCAGLLQCGEECISQGTGTQVELSCPNNKEPCTMNSIWILPCSKTGSQDARVVCGKFVLSMHIK